MITGESDRAQELYDFCSARHLYTSRSISLISAVTAADLQIHNIDDEAQHKLQIRHRVMLTRPEILS